jgi:hypothetical protein
MIPLVHGRSYSASTVPHDVTWKLESNPNVVWFEFRI